MVTLQDIQHAQVRIAGVAIHTPLVLCPAHAQDTKLYFKAENFQPMGAFKIRGAYNAIASLSHAERQRGVVAHSSGNHAQAVAYAARALHTKAVIVMPRNAPEVKLRKTKEYGAEVVMVGNAGSERAEKADALVAQHGYVLVPPYDDERVIAGQGTLGLEILHDLPDVGVLLVPVSGGGLLAGVAAAVKLSKPHVKVIGVEPVLAGDATESFRQKKLVSFTAEQTGRTIADGLRMQQLGALTYPLIQNYVDDMITVSEDEIRAATRKLILNAKLVAEPSGAVPFAAWLYHREQIPVVPITVAVVSGGNIDSAMLLEILGGK